MSDSRFSQRWDQPEIMDDLDFSGKEMDQALRELETINKWLGGNAVTLAGLNRLKPLFPRDRTISLVDVGCGGGDMLMLIADWADENGIDLKLTGVDANAYIVEYARNHTLKYPQIEYQVANVFDEEFHRQSYDIVTTTLFTHHFTQQQLGVLLPRWVGQSRFGVVINDLHRHWLSYYSIITLTRLLSKSPMVKNDGPISVLRAFRKNDLQELMQQHDIQNYILQWRWAFRWLLVITKDELPKIK